MRVQKGQKDPETSMTSKLANLTLNMDEPTETRHSTALVPSRRGTAGHTSNEIHGSPLDLARHGRRVRGDIGYHDNHRDSSTERSAHGARPPGLDTRRWGPMEAAAGAAVFAGDDNDNPHLPEFYENPVFKNDQRVWESSTAGENATIYMGDRNFRNAHRSNKPHEHSSSQSLTRKGDGMEYLQAEHESRLRRDHCS